jgi:hypothetical protein
MRWLARALVLTVPLGLAYLAWPVYAALELRDAITAGDGAALEHRVDWPALRASVKASLTPDMMAKLLADPAAPKPTIWQRIKAAVAPSMADAVVERYVTPESLPLLFGHRTTPHGAAPPAAALAQPPTVLAGTVLAGSGADRLATFWSKVRRAVFYSPMRFEIEVEDAHRPGRHYVGKFELKGFAWKLTGLGIAGDSF